MSKRNPGKRARNNQPQQLLPPNQGPNGGSMVQWQASAFSGPIPSPDDLERYEKLYPGLADRLVKMTETQSAHRQALEKKVVFGRRLPDFEGFLA